MPSSDRRTWRSQSVNGDGNFNIFFKIYFLIVFDKFFCLIVLRDQWCDSVYTASFLSFQALRAKRAVEQTLDEAHSKITELTTLNVNLTSAKGKLENEYLSLHNDYEEISKELRVRKTIFF